jgi:hypothetical protein
MDRLLRLPLHPLLLAAYAVLFVYAGNLAEVLPIDLARPLGWALLGAAVVLIVASLLYRDTRRGALVASVLVIAVAYFGHLSPELARLGLEEPAQLALWALAILLVGVYALRARGSLTQVTAGLNVFAIGLVAISLIAIVPHELGRIARAAPTERTIDRDLPEATRSPGRDIYFLVFDRYGSDWAMQTRWGVDNDLPEWLSEQGFQVVPGARTNYRATDFTLATILSMDFLNDLTESVGRVAADRTPARDRIPDHPVGRFLQSNGYTYYHLGAWYEPTRTSPIADEVLTYGRTPEFDAVLRESSVIPALERLVDQGPRDTDFRYRHRNEALFQLRQVERLASVPGRKFVFAHILLPHPPYVFRADGSHIFEEEERRTPEEDLLPGQLAFTNERIRETVEVLLAGPDEEDPIIVITGDEGPFICWHIDCVDGSPESLGIRFGTLRAYYLPGLEYVVPPDDTTVNIFRMLFREYFGADLPDLPNRSWNWPDNDHLYDFRDVTDELPLPGG